jgi:DnaJ-class molecular chaperone
MLRTVFDPYGVLGVKPTATQAEITRAYRQQLRAHHPDTRATSTHSAATADSQLRQVVSAYALLRDPGRRADYDRTANRYPTAPPVPATDTQGMSGPVRIPVRHRSEKTQAAPGQRPPLWAGPVRRIH